ncbi:MAG: nuclear transport factor 2 family protein [Jatrophihabitans sp.]
MTERPAAAAAWHALVEARDPAMLDGLLADDVVFRSPAVFTPQEGKALTTRYLTGALAVLGPTLRYLNEWYGPRSAVLEFEADLDGAYVQGVDILHWNDADQLTQFTVIVRPLRGLQALLAKVGTLLEAS